MALVVDQIEARVLAQTHAHFAVIFDARDREHTRDDDEQDEHEGNDGRGRVEEGGLEVQRRRAVSIRVENGVRLAVKVVAKGVRRAHGTDRCVEAA